MFNHISFSTHEYKRSNTGTVDASRTEGVVYLATSLRCQFGDVSVEASFESENSITCVAPNLEGSVDVRISANNGEDWSESAAKFEYTATLPRLVAIEPSLGSVCILFERYEIHSKIKNANSTMTNQRSNTTGTGRKYRDDSRMELCSLD